MIMICATGSCNRCTISWLCVTIFDRATLQIVNHCDNTGSSIQKDTLTVLNQLTGTATDSGFSVKIDRHTILHQQLSGFRQNLIQAFSDSTAVHSSHLSSPSFQLHQIASNRGLTDVKLLCDIPYMDGSFSSTFCSRYNLRSVDSIQSLIYVNSIAYARQSPQYDVTKVRQIERRKSILTAGLRYGYGHL